MKTWSFSVELEGIDCLHDQVEDSLYEVGCSDALIWSRGGSIILDFDREASSYNEAVSSAMADIDSADLYGTGVRVFQDGS